MKIKIRAYSKKYDDWVFLACGNWDAGLVGNDRPRYDFTNTKKVLKEIEGDL